MGAAGIADSAPNETYRLPDALRSRLATPLGPVLQRGELIDALADAEHVIAVGDVVSLTLNQLGIEPTAFICDYITERGKGSQGFQQVLGQWGEKELRCRNPAGSITREAWLAVREAIQDPAMVRVVVDGEEDLLGLAAFLEAPVGAKVIYGVPGQGVCVVSVDGALKEQAAEIVKAFDGD